ncbi:MAG TPA: DNA alkylation repair protein [Candidatus Saccharimonadales bacterium]|nr:DNA alkylation repair protein [Candidatus Saccharimonadales bacterium]
MTAADVIAALNEYARPHAVDFLQHFFKTHKGGYGEGDLFIGVRVPPTRIVCKQFKDLSLPEVQKLFDSAIHEHRLAAGLILTYQYPKSTDKKAIYDLYLKNVWGGRVNNWDIVDTTAPKVVGRYLLEADAPRDILFKLARSQDVWQKRTGILSSFYFLMKGDDPTITLELAEILVDDKHDMIQKAVGWMLREVGKRFDTKLLTDFLDQHAATMPRTALRYALEHLSPETKLHYMQRKNNA